MTYRQGAWLFGVVLGVSMLASEVGYFISGWGTLMWLIGLCLTAITGPCFGYCAGRVYTDRGHLPMKLFR